MGSKSNASLTNASEEKVANEISISFRAITINDKDSICVMPNT
jgi:hypothetical protein